MDKDTALRLALEVLEKINFDTGNPDAQDAIKPIKAALEAKDEPVAWMYSPTGALFDICPNDADEGEFLPLYTTPPQRTWVKLTNQELADCWDTIPERAMRRVEAKLKELNT